MLIALAIIGGLAIFPVAYILSWLLIRASFRNVEG